MRIWITWHRESFFSNTKEIKSKIFTNLDKIILDNIDNNLLFNIGWANGVDLWVAEWCILNNINYKLYLPFNDIDKQIKDWNIDQKELFYYIYDNVKCIEKIFYNWYFERNRGIVDNSDILYAWMIKETNTWTWYTVNYAKKKNIKVINLI